jgi:hypothetical protein
MARYTLPVDVNRRKGSVGGSCFQRVGVQYIIRHRTVPTKKRTNRKRKVANLFGSLSSQHKALTSGNRSQWLSQASNYPRTDSLGNGYTFNGLNMQVGSNANLRNNNQSQIAQPVSGSTPADLLIDFTLCSFSTNDLTIRASVPIVPAGYRYALYASVPVTQMPARPNLKSMRLLYTVGEGGDTNSNIFSNWLARFPGVAWSPGQRIVLAFRQMPINTGQWSNPVFAQSSPIF